MGRLSNYPSISSVRLKIKVQFEKAWLYHKVFVFYVSRAMEGYEKKRFGPESAHDEIHTLERSFRMPGRNKPARVKRKERYQ